MLLFLLAQVVTSYTPDAAGEDDIKAQVMKLTEKLDRNMKHTELLTAVLNKLLNAVSKNNVETCKDALTGWKDS